MRYSELFSRSLSLFKDKARALDLRMLLEAAFNLSSTGYWLKKNEEITDRTGLRQFYRHRRRLLNGEPIAYIQKKKEFYGETFYIDKNVLIPRPETEILVEHAVRLIKAPVEILDIGAGSGNIAIMLAKHTGGFVTAVENSKGALYVLKKNIRRHQVGDRVTTLDADLFPPALKKFAVIVANPPYVSEGEWRELDPGVRDYEPAAALVAGKEGLDVIKRIIAGCRSYLEPGGKLLLEIGYNQKRQVKELLINTGFPTIEFFDDYGGVPRVAYGEQARTIT